MKVLNGNVNVYDLTGGKTLPYWLKGNKRKELLKKNPDLKNRKIDIIQDFNMPDLCSNIVETNDGQYILIAGLYGPLIRCYDTQAHSQKFERGIDNRILDMLSIYDDYSKIVILEEGRWLELHNKGGRSTLERMPRQGLHLDYHYPDCDVYISTTGPEVDIFNLNEGRMKTPLVTNSNANNTLAIHPDYHSLAIGSAEGTVEIWDPQNTQRGASGVLTIDQSSFAFESSSACEVTAMRFNKWTLAVGTSDGQVLLYDIRARKPYSETNQSREMIKSIKFHSSGNIMCMSSSYLKIWDYTSNETLTSITSDVTLNDLCSIDKSGMIFMASDQSKIKSYFIPALGDAPKWCTHLDSLVEELKEEDPIEYDDYIHVNAEELKELSLHNSSEGVVATVNGFKVRSDVYHKMKTITYQLVQEEFIERKIKNKVTERNRSKLPVAVETPKINAEIYTTLAAFASTPSGTESKICFSAIDDTRFKDMFYHPMFVVDEEEQDYCLLSYEKNKSGKRKEMS